MKAEEDPYLYTTVSVVPPVKKRKEKDFLGCIVLIGVMFAIISIQLACYTFKISRLSFIKQVPIAKMMEIEAFMAKQNKEGHEQITKLTDKTIPLALNTVFSRSCQTFISTVASEKTEWSMDKIQEFLVFKDLGRENFMTFQNVRWEMTPTFLFQNGFKFEGGFEEKDGIQYALMKNTRKNLNKIDTFEIRACFIKRGILKNGTAPPKRNLESSDQKALRKRRLRAQNDK